MVAMAPLRQSQLIDDFKNITRLIPSCDRKVLLGSSSPGASPTGCKRWLEHKSPDGMERPSRGRRPDEYHVCQDVFRILSSRKCQEHELEGVRPGHESRSRLVVPVFLGGFSQDVGKREDVRYNVMLSGEPKSIVVFQAAGDLRAGLVGKSAHGRGTKKREALVVLLRGAASQSWSPRSIYSRENDVGGGGGAWREISGECTKIEGEGVNGHSLPKVEENG